MYKIFMRKQNYVVWKKINKKSIIIKWFKEIFINNIIQYFNQIKTPMNYHEIYFEYKIFYFM